MAMDQRLILHIVDGDSRSRAEQARTAFALGHHAEVYSDLSELWERPPFAGILLLRQEALDVPLSALFDRLGEKGAWLPVIVCSESPEIEDIVGAVKGGPSIIWSFRSTPGGSPGHWLAWSRRRRRTAGPAAAPPTRVGASPN